MALTPPIALARLRAARRDAGFREELSRLARLGARVGSGLGVAAVVLFVGIHVAVLGKTPRWSYAEGAVVLWDKAVLVGLCLGIAGVAPRLGLGTARALVAALVVVGAAASVADDVAAGSTSFSAGFVTFMYLLAVVAVPYRPGQTAALGGVLTGVTYLVFRLAPAVTGAPVVVEEPGHYVYLSIVTILLSGVSGLLYLTRYGQYRSRREAEALAERVQVAEAAKGRFFTNVSHEIRTPLTLILGPVRDALSGHYGPLSGRLRERLSGVDEQARQLRDLVDQILDVSKLEAGAMPLRVREHDLGALVRRQASQFRSAVERRGGTLYVETPDDPVEVWVDAERLERVLSNLLSNAVKHTPADGAVRVRVRLESAEAVLSVRDAGAGIEPETLSVVFDRFASVGGTGQASTGIGLALVKEIVERHGGRVEVESEPGFGAEFTVRLPLGTAHLAPEDIALPASEAPPAAPHLDRPPSAPEADLDPEADRAAPPDAPAVVVAEDNDAVRAYLVDLLGADYRVIEAADGADAWARVQEHRPALVVSDVMMPEIDGLDLCARIRGDDALASTPVLLLTARADEEARLDGWRSGADAYLAKPFSGDELLAIAEHLVWVRQRLRDRVRVPDWLAPGAVEVADPDAAFLERVHGVVADHLGDSGFGVDRLAAEVGLSARQLQRRLKVSTRLTAAAYVRAVRLEQAARLLRETGAQVQEVARAVGYEDADHFARLFRQVHGVPPSEFAAGPVEDRP